MRKITLEIKKLCFDFKSRKFLATSKEEKVKEMKEKNSRCGVKICSKPDTH